MDAIQGRVDAPLVSTDNQVLSVDSGILRAPTWSWAADATLASVDTNALSVAIIRPSAAASRLFADQSPLATDG
jgi:hypothetical protein